MYFIPEVSSVTLPVLLLSPLAIITGIAEESLWRGAYVSAFGSNLWLGVAFPTVAYTLAHLSPQSIFPSESGTAAFLVSVAFLGLAYGIVAYRMGSARWTAIAHASANVLAFGGALVPAIARLLGFDA
jgi:membrane protease YdiL (CAAX protease family)